MTLDEYQKKAESTEIPIEIAGTTYLYPTLGLFGEAGELVNKVKKIFRDDAHMLSDEKRKDILDELGDVLWYVAILSKQMGSSLESVAVGNVEKLKARAAKGTIHGSGDNR